MKKKLFVTFAAATLIAAVAPTALAYGGSQFNPAPNATFGSTYVTDADIAARVEAEIVARQADLEAVAAQDPAAVEAQAKVDAILANGGGHEYQQAAIDLQNALYNARMRATDKFRAERIAAYTQAAKEDGSYYGRGVEGNKNFDKTGDVNNDGQPEDKPEVKPEDKPEVKPEDKAKADEAAKKATEAAKKSEEGKKVLPKTSAAK